ncbi:glycosyl hydrolase 115 family protein [Roseiterribacter gracilis]|uniref:Gylcosyl hydrolase 115 C-terminal domain-containing protein n=1 Tax=Roseiterribacter gracilis TaxID=2812848 RepID=A0A8S8XJ01_9PROT|nr:hypothetical protein TMPK1_34020 [Rhodospirillales bacterium TMPK1]
MMLRLLIVALCLLSGTAFALGQDRYVTFVPGAGAFAIVQGKSVAPIFVDLADFAGVVRAAKNLQTDIARVTRQTPKLVQGRGELGSAPILIGTIGKSSLIDQLIRDGKLDVTDVAGKWEAFVIQTVANPLPGVASALVIAGSDKRGTTFGIYDLAEQIGVSPWAWWADVPVVQHDALFVVAGRHVERESPVKYRGIFLNDEAPALAGWAQEKFGGLNHQFYEHVFELILRLKGNYLWPAMWANAFNEDDPLNPKIADEYGIVMGTSHHEPMLRAQQEWKRHGKGPWDYSKNEKVLQDFWREGVRRNKDLESIITLAMRGDGDEPMSEDANVALLQKIVADQRKILSEEVNPDLTKIPQLWALYKEVQEYYEKGMRVPDDVTLLWCDDNWGNIRRLPTAEERKRSGGAGVYYHFDYVGDPRNYKWINTNPIAKVWEQMSQALDYGADRIWIVNVGDLKPMEFPIDFFLNFARDPKRWPKEKLSEFARLWAEREFGAAHATEIADIVTTYGTYVGRRKPELLEPSTFSQLNYREADRVVADYQALVTRAEKVSAALPPAARDAFFQLVLHPAKAASIVTELYVTAARNRLYAAQGRASTNDLAARVRTLFQADADLTAAYHKLGNGKWNHMMDQTHIGYTYWQQPPANVMPAVSSLLVAAQPQMGVAVEGAPQSWPGAWGAPVLPDLNVLGEQRRYIDVFNKGAGKFDFTATASEPWIALSTTRGTVEKDLRLWVRLDASKAPTGRSSGAVTITTPGMAPVTVRVHAFNPSIPSAPDGAFVEADRYVAIEAEHFTRKEDAGAAAWQKIDHYGHTLSGMAVFPTTTESALPPAAAPRLEYRMYLTDPGKVDVEAIVGPTLPFVPGRGLRYAVAFDDETPQVIDIWASNTAQDWQRAVSDNARKPRSTHTVSGTGFHTLKLWMVDPGVVLQRLVVDLGGVRPSYLGPPESARVAR